MDKEDILKIFAVLITVLICIGLFYYTCTTSTNIDNVTNNTANKLMNK